MGNGRRDGPTLEPGLPPRVIFRRQYPVPAHGRQDEKSRQPSVSGAGSRAVSRASRQYPVPAHGP